LFGESSSATAGLDKVEQELQQRLHEFEQELQQEKYSTIPNKGLKLSLDIWNGSISVLFKDWIAPDDTFKMPDRLTNQLYGRDILNTWINDKAQNAPSIEKVREITAKIPSLTKLLLDDRNNE